MLKPGTRNIVAKVTRRAMETTVYQQMPLKAFSHSWQESYPSLSNLPKRVTLKLNNTKRPGLR